MQGDPPPPHFPPLVKYPDLPMRKILWVVGLLTVMIFFQRKTFAACKNIDEKEETIFYFLMVFNLLKIIHTFESKRHLRTLWNLIASHKNIWYFTNRFKNKLENRLEKHITYFTEIKEENSSNIASSYVIRKMLLEFSSLITLNENLYFKIWSPFQLPP